MLRYEIQHVKLFDQVRFQSIISYNNFASDSKVPPNPSLNQSDEIFNKAFDLINKTKVNSYSFFVQKQFKQTAEKNPSKLSLKVLFFYLFNYSVYLMY